MIKEGEKAPDFALESEQGTIRLRDLRGQWVVLFFYPKDMTSGCTIEACEFRDAHPRFEDLDAVVLGVSPDSVDSHRKFREAHGFQFPLLADTDHEVAEEYGVWQEKSMYGKKYWGIARTTFLIDPEGKVAKVFEKVKPAGHPVEVASAIEELKKAS